MRRGTIVAREDGTRRGGRVVRNGPRPGKVLVRWSGGTAVDELWTTENKSDLYTESTRDSGYALLRRVA